MEMDDTDYFTLLTCFFFLPQTKLFCKVFRKQSSISFFVCVWGEWKCCNDTGKGSDFHSIRLQHYPPSLLCSVREALGVSGALTVDKKVNTLIICLSHISILPLQTCLFQIKTLFLARSRLSKRWLIFICII